MTNDITIACITAGGLTLNCCITALFGVLIKGKANVIQNTVDGNFSKMWKEKEEKQQALMELRGENSELIGRQMEKERHDAAAP